MTDLLDGWEDGSVELPPPAGMSPERIKERTMEKIRQTKRPWRWAAPARAFFQPLTGIKFLFRLKEEINHA